MTRLAIMMLLLYVLGACSKSSDDPVAAFESGDYATALMLWKSGAAVGDTEAQYRLGILYYLGYGVQRDYREAYTWYKRAAESGHPGAQRELGLMYESGRLGQRNFEQAYMWLFAAYQQGNPNSAQVLRMISGQLSPNRVQALKYEARQYIKNDVVDPEDDDF